jgi:hypothetical protein
VDLRLADEDRATVERFAKLTLERLAYERAMARG